MGSGKRRYFTQVGWDNYASPSKCLDWQNRIKSHTWSFPYFPHQWLSSDTLCQFKRKEAKWTNLKPQKKELKTGVTASLGLLTMLQHSSFLVSNFLYIKLKNKNWFIKFLFLRQKQNYAAVCAFVGVMRKKEVMSSHVCSREIACLGHMSCSI